MTAQQPALVLSGDRRTAAVYLTDGRKVAFDSASPDGFTEQQLAAMIAADYAPVRVVPGQRRTVRRRTLGPVHMFVHTSTGPPTWWLPRVGLRRTSDAAGATVMAGWLRGMLAVTVQRSKQRRTVKP